MEKIKLIDWPNFKITPDTTTQKQLAEFYKKAIAYGVADNEIRLFITSCAHLLGSEHFHALKARLADSLREYKQRLSKPKINSKPIKP